MAKDGEITASQGRDTELPTPTRSHDGKQKRPRIESTVDLETPKRGRTAYSAAVSTTNPAAATSDRDRSYDQNVTNIHPDNPDLPRTPFTHPVRPSIEQTMSDATNPVIHVYQRAVLTGYEDEAIKQVAAHLKIYANPTTNYEPPAPTAFCGKAGSGKSLLLSCALDKPGIALDSKDPVRGTNLPHEYATFDPDRKEMPAADKPTYRVAVSYHSLPHIKRVVEDFCRDAFKYLESRDEEEEEEEEEEASDYNDTPTPAEAGTEFLSSQEGQVKYNAAIAWLFTLICNEDGFRTKEDVDNFFEEKHADRKTQYADFQFMPYTSDDEVFIWTVEKIMAFIRELWQTRPTTEVAQDLPGLQHVFTKISKPHTTSAAQIWPIAEKLRISFDHDLLNIGAVLVDTPGLSDSDQNIVDSTISCIKNAGAWILSATFSRSTADSVFDKVIALAVQHKKHHNLYLVLTMIDENRPQRSAEDKRSMKLSSEDAAALQAAQQDKEGLLAQQNALEGKRSQLSADRSVYQTQQQELMESIQPEASVLVLERLKSCTARMHGTTRELDTVQTELGGMQTRIQEAQDKIEELELQFLNKADQAAIQAENNSVKKIFESKIRDRTGNKRDPDLPVIFASAKQYQKNLECPQGRDHPFMTREATGLPSVKRLLYSLATKNHFAKLKEDVLDNAPRLLRKGIAHLSEKQQIPQLDQKRQRIEREIEDGIKRILQRLDNETKIALESHIQMCFSDKDNLTRWKRKALRFWKSLPGLVHAKTFLSFCLRNGRWKVKKMDHSWNYRIIKIYRGVVEPACDAFQDKCEGIFQNATHDVKDLFGRSKKSLETGPCTGAAGNGILLTLVKRIESRLLEKLKDFFDGQMKNLSSIRDNLLLDSESSELGHGCYVFQAMRCAYDEAAAIETKTYTCQKGKRAQAAHRDRHNKVREGIMGIKPNAAGRAGLPNVFEAVRLHACKDFGEQRASMLARFGEHLEAGFRIRVMEVFDHQYSKSSVSNNADAKSNNEILLAMKEALKMYEGCEELVAKCEEWKRPGGALI